MLITIQEYANIFELMPISGKPKQHLQISQFSVANFSISKSNKEVWSVQ